MKLEEIDRHQWILGAILIVASLLVYTQAVSFPLQTFDGKPMIIGNESMHHWSSIPGFFKNDIWETSGTGLRRYYRPLASILGLVTYKLVGINAAGWHASSILFHMGAVLMFWRLLKQTGYTNWVSFGAALLFAVHPVHVENVASVAGGTDPLLAIFFFSALFAYFKWQTSRETIWLVSTVGLTLASLLIKEVGAVLPVLMILHDLFFGERSAEVWKRRAQLWVSVVAVLALYVAMRKFALGVVDSSPQHSWRDVVRTAPYLAWLYLRQSFVPFALAGWYDVNVIKHWSFTRVILPMILCFASFVAIAYGLVKKKVAAFWGAFWWLTLAISLAGVRVFVEQDLIHDRYNYIPLGALCLLVAYVLVDETSPLRRLSIVSRAVLLAGLVVGLGVMAALQTWTWRSDPAIYAQAIRVSPRTIRPRNLFAGELLKEGAVADALRFSAETLELDPNRWESNFTYGIALSSAGRTEDSLRFMKRCIALDPRRSVSYIVGARELVALGNRADAASLLDSAPVNVDLPEQISAEKRMLLSTGESKQ